MKPDEKFERIMAEIESLNIDGHEKFRLTVLARQLRDREVDLRWAMRERLVIIGAIVFGLIMVLIGVMK